MAESGSVDLSHVILHGIKLIGKELGRGAFGRVFEVDHGGTLCAGKEIHKLLLEYVQGEALQKLKDDFISECAVWSTLRHPNVVLFLGVYYPLGDESGLPIMVMEKMEESIRSLVEKYENIPLMVKLSILHDACLGLRYLHGLAKPIIHRDLSTNNIMVTSHLQAKITDLGQAKLVELGSRSTMSMAPGTTDFMPPEAMQLKCKYGPKLDIFSFGAVALHLVTQVWPTPSSLVQFDEETGRREVISEVARRKEFIDMMTGAAEELVPLVVSCLVDNPKERPPLEDVTNTIEMLMGTIKNNTTRDAMDAPTWLYDVFKQDELPNSHIMPAIADMFKKPVKINWEEGKPPPSHRVSHTAVLLQGSIFVGSGFQMGDHSYQIDIYNLDNNAWNATPIKTPQCWFGMTVLNNRLIIAGGWVKEKKGMFNSTKHKVTNKIFILDTGQWKDDYGEMPTARSSVAAASHRSMLILAGGIANNGSKLDTTELLDTVTNTWYTCGTLPKPHYQLQPVIVGNMFYLLCGLNEQCEPSTAAFAAPLDTLSKHQLNWEAISCSPWQYSAAVGVYGAHLLVMGGGKKEESSVTMTSSIYAYHQFDRTWNTVASMPAARLQSSAVCVTNNRIVVMGGRNTTRGYINTVWIGQFQL